MLHKTLPTKQPEPTSIPISLAVQWKVFPFSAASSSALSFPARMAAWKWKNIFIKGDTKWKTPSPCTIDVTSPKRSACVAQVHTLSRYVPNIFCSSLLKSEPNVCHPRSSNLKQKRYFCPHNINRTTIRMTAKNTCTYSQSSEVNLHSWTIFMGGCWEMENYLNCPVIMTQK